jgi:putative oxidoreductase
VGFLLLAARILLGLIFVYAAYAKLHFNGAWHLRDYYFFFAMGIDSYKMLPLAIVEWMAKILPWVELALGAMLVIGAGVRWAGLVVSALLVVFMIALAHAALGGLEINCGCFGNNSVKPSTELARDVGLLAVALAVTVGGFLSHRAGKSQA